MPPAFRALFTTEKINTVPGTSFLIKVINHQVLLILQQADMLDLCLPPLLKARLFKLSSRI